MFSFISSRTECRDVNSDSRSSWTLLELAWCHKKDEEIKGMQSRHWQGLGHTSVSVPPSCPGFAWECTQSWKSRHSLRPACAWSYAEIPRKKETKSKIQLFIISGKKKDKKDNVRSIQGLRVSFQTHEAQPTLVNILHLNLQHSELVPAATKHSPSSLHWLMYPLWLKQ